MYVSQKSVHLYSVQITALYHLIYSLVYLKYIKKAFQPMTMTMTIYYLTTIITICRYHNSQRMFTFVKGPTKVPHVYYMCGAYTCICNTSISLHDARSLSERLLGHMLIFIWASVKPLNKGHPFCRASVATLEECYLV